MKLIEILKVAFAAIWAHKLRSALTLLGMIVGVTAFVTVVSLIQGFNVYIDEKIANIGAKSFSIQRFNPFEDFKDTDTIAAAQRRNKELTMDDYDFIKQRSVLIAKIGAKARGTPALIKRGDQILEDVFVSGVTANTADIDNRTIADGRFFSETEADGAARVAYVGADIATKLFPGRQCHRRRDRHPRPALPHRRDRGSQGNCLRNSAGQLHRNSAENLSAGFRPADWATVAVLHGHVKE